MSILLSLCIFEKRGISSKCLLIIQFNSFHLYVLETITPRESSDDTGNKAHEDGMIKTQSVDAQENKNISSIVVSGEEAGAVGGDEDDSVFVDDAIPSTSKEIDTIAQSPPFRSSVDITTSIYNLLHIRIKNGLELYPHIKAQHRKK